MASQNTRRSLLLLSGILLGFASPQAQNSGSADSVPFTKELVIATSNAHHPSPHKTASAAVNPGVDDLHPMAVAFVKDYLDDHQARLEKMKSWGTPYFRMIDQILTKYRLPSELKYLAVIESNLKTTALSNKGAVGPWQFMAETGRLYGLKIAGSRDDRRDLYRSTHAAAKYLRDLHKQLGDWLLVIAAYNGGDARVESAIRKSGSRDFWKLQYFLPAESRNHVKKFIATHYIMEGRGGVTTTTAADLAKRAATAPDSSLVAGMEKQVVTGKYQSLIVAKTLGMDILEFNAMNPGFDKLVATAEYTLHLPADKMELFNARRNQILGESVQFILANYEATKEEYPETIKMPTGKKGAGN